MDSQKTLSKEEKLEYTAPAAEVTDIEIEQKFLQTAGSGTLPSGGVDGGEW